MLMRTPDAFAALAILATLLGEWLLPLPILPPASVTGPATLIGALIAIAGLSLEIAAARALARANTPTRPNQPPTALVTSGPFAHSRNPFYAGILLLLTGLALTASLDWSVIFLPLVWLMLDRFVIPAE